MLSERLAKRMRHLRKWARRQDIGCFRVYERDIPDFPIVIDWFDDLEGPPGSGDAVAWFHQRTRDDTDEETLAYRRVAEEAILDGLDLSRDHLFIKERGRQRDDEGGRSQYERVGSQKRTKLVHEHGSDFEINLSDYLDVGLFLDHRPTRLAVRQRSEGKRVLNLFAYTGAFSVHARAGGATRTKTIDLSGNYLDWYERNLAHNGFAPDADHVTVQADCLEWLEAGPAGDEAYDLIICDPPTFSNSKRMKAASFAIERDYPMLLSWLTRFVAPGGEIFFSSNSRRFELDLSHLPEDFGGHEISHRSIPEDFRNRKIHRCWRLAQGWTPRKQRTPR